jgi:hypothetical protein
MPRLINKNLLFKGRKYYYLLLSKILIKLNYHEKIILHFSF